MATTNTPSTLASRLKERYPKGPSQIVPNSTELRKRITFKKDCQPGELVRFDVQLTHEHGFSTGQGEITLNGATAQESAKAEVEGFSVILQSKCSYDLITRAKDSKNAFSEFNTKNFIPMVESMQKRCEVLDMGYGRQGLGTVLTASGSGVFIISTNSWCAALWSGMKGQTLEAFTDVAAQTQHDGDVVISAVDIAAKTITVTGTSTAIVAGDIFFYEGNALQGPYGLTDIAVNAGTLYNISAATYELWAAQSYDVGTSALTLGKLLEAAAKSADMGCDEKLTVLVPTATFAGLVSDESALTRHGASRSKTNGADKLTFYGPTGEMEIVPYKFIKDGEFVMFPERYTYRIGSSDIVNRLKNGDIHFDLESTSAVEMRLFTEYTIFCERPAWIVRGTRSDSLALHA